MKHYDFRTPDRVDRGLLRTLHNLHVDFARRVCRPEPLHTGARSDRGEAAWSGINSPVRELLARLDESHVLEHLARRAVARSLDRDIQPRCSIRSSTACWRRQFGGPTTRRPPTEIELRLAGRIGEILCEKLRHAWDSVADLRPKLLRIRSHPRAVQAAPSDDGAIVVRFGISLGQRRGMMRLACRENA